MKQLLFLGFFVLAMSVSPSAPAASRTLGSRVNTQLLKNERYALRAETVGECKVGAPCKVVVTIEAMGEFHVNKDFPFSFSASATDGLLYQGDDKVGPHVFTKAKGDFAMDPKSELRGYLTLQFTPTRRGSFNITGKYKICVCNAQNCQPETQEIAVPITAK